MSRPTRIEIREHALLHNLRKVKQLAPGKRIFAMVKANAYGCGLEKVVPVLEGKVDAFGVACLEEAFAIKSMGSQTELILFQGVFQEEEYQIAAREGFSCVIHHPEQLEWLEKARLPYPLKIWIKVNTGMNRLGFMPELIKDVVYRLKKIPHINKKTGLMTHFACADEKEHPQNQQQISQFNTLKFPEIDQYSAANSAAIFNFPEAHADAVRPGIMLYGISPFAEQQGQQLGLIPVMQFSSAISTIHDYPANQPVGYGAEWHSSKPAKIAVVPVGYGDGYPRHLLHTAFVWVNGQRAPIVGRVSMDMITVNITGCKSCQPGDTVELWGHHIPVEEIAGCSGTIAYELICGVAQRTRR